MIARIQRLVASSYFEQVVLTLILINAVWLFFQADIEPTLFHKVEFTIVLLFLGEFILRFLGRRSTREWISDPWTWFDAAIITVSLIPPEMFGGQFAAVLRTLRVLRILRVFRISEELSLIIMVLVKSIRSLGYAGFVFFIFLYIYAVTGVTLFKSDQATAALEWNGNPQWIDPYGSPAEAMFTLFRILTGDDWTDLRYDLIGAFPEMSVTITLFHVSWMILSAFLLLNLVIGAVINNYDRTMEEVRLAKEAKDKQKAAAPGE